MAAQNVKKGQTEEIKKAKDVKREQIEAIKKDIQACSSLTIVDYKGITVAKDTALRTEFRKSGVKYVVLKNRLVFIAFKELGIEGFDEILNETNAFAFGFDDAVAPARIAEKADADKSVVIKGGRLGNEKLNANGVKALAKVPKKEVLVAQFLGLLQSPVAAFARALAAIVEKQSGGKQATAE